MDAIAYIQNNEHDEQLVRLRQDLQKCVELVNYQTDELKELYEIARVQSSDIYKLKLEIKNLRSSNSL